VNPLRYQNLTKPKVTLPKVKNVIKYQIRLRTKPEVSKSAIILNSMPINAEWDYCGEAKDGSGNTWYAVKNGDKIGWSAAIYNGNTWIKPIDDLNILIPAKVKNITDSPINIRAYPFVSPSARIVGMLNPNKATDCFGYKVDTVGNVWFAVKNNNVIGWSAAKYNGDEWIVPIG